MWGKGLRPGGESRRLAADIQYADNHETDSARELLCPRVTLEPVERAKADRPPQSKRKEGHREAGGVYPEQQRAPPQVRCWADVGEQGGQHWPNAGRPPCRE